MPVRSACKLTRLLLVSSQCNRRLLRMILAVGATSSKVHDPDGFESRTRRLNFHFGTADEGPGSQSRANPQS